MRGGVKMFWIVYIAALAVTVWGFWRVTEEENDGK